MDPDCADHLFRIQLIGDSGVGKSCLMLRYFDDAYTESYISTIGVDFKIRTIVRGGEKIKLQVYDLIVDRFNAYPSTAMYRRSHGIIAMLDLTDMASFKHMRPWVIEIHRFSAQKVNVMLMGTKCDLTTKRVVSEEDVSKLLLDIEDPLELFNLNKRITYVETSAKYNVNVDLAFDVMAFEILRWRRKCTKECEPAFVVERERRWQRRIHSQCTPDVQERVKTIMCVWALRGEGSGLGKLPVEVLDLILVLAHAEDEGYSAWEWDDKLLAGPGGVLEVEATRLKSKRRCSVC
eukprot:TRINITY_DN4222_c0_g3_i3.p1 TRINITY_DN4222_c0_g3~~TRINITY_DN4222_c0_g3_i3.p1  ORF type:complete len:292 (+),score=39.02 TRINITY_DN4222_c0_g3_i3:214-1089(+)